MIETAKELEYMDLCTVFNQEEQMMDENGDTSDMVVCENQICDFQSERTQLHNGVLVQYSPMLYLPADFEKVKEISRNWKIIVSRYRMGGTEELAEEDYNGNPNKKHLAECKVEDWQEINIRGKLLGIQLELREVTYL